MLSIDKQKDNYISIYANYTTIDIEFTNQTNKNTYNLTNILNSGTASNYSTFVITDILLNNFQEGMYNYIITTGTSSNLIEKGIAQITDDNNDPIIYYTYSPDVSFFYWTQSNI